MIKTCSDCEYYFRGICNAGRCPTNLEEQTDCSDFQLVERLCSEIFLKLLCLYPDQKLFDLWHFD